MSGLAGLFLAMAVSAQRTGASTEPPRGERETLRMLEKDMTLYAEGLPPLVRRLEELRARCRFARRGEWPRLKAERISLEKDFHARMNRLNAAQAAFDQARRDRRARGRLDVVRGALAGAIIDEGYESLSAAHKRNSVKTDSLIAWAGDALAAETEACSRPERRRATLLFFAKWAGICLSAAALLAGALYFAFLAAP